MARRPIMAFITDCSYSTPAVSDGKSIESYLTRLYELKIHAWLILNDLPRTCFNSLFFSTLRLIDSVSKQVTNLFKSFLIVVPGRVYSGNSS
jgi:hypothetical protein